MIFLYESAEETETGSLELGKAFVVAGNPPSVSVYLSTYNMVLIVDGNSDIGAYVRSNLFYSICLRHLIRSRQSKI